MAAKIIGKTPNGHNIHYGTDAERIAMIDVTAMTEFFRNDGACFEANGAGGWNQTRIGGSRKVILYDSAGNEVTSFGSSGLTGTPVMQVPVTASTTGSAVLIFSEPLKGVRLTCINLNAGSAAVPTPANGYFNFVAQPPSDLIALDWLDETLAGPRTQVSPGQPIDVPFTDPVTGDPIYLTTWAHKASVIDASLKLFVEGFK